MSSYVRTQSGVGSSSPIRLDMFQAAGGCEWQAIVTGSATFTVDHSNDHVTPDYFTGLLGSPTNWFTNTSGSASTEGTFATTPQWMRVTISAGTGSVVLTVRQAGPGS